MCVCGGGGGGGGGVGIWVKWDVSKMFGWFYFSVFDGMPIPYPKREFITDDENDDKSDSKAGDKVSWMYISRMWPPSSRIVVSLSVVVMIISMFVVVGIVLQNVLLK